MTDEQTNVDNGGTGDDAATHPNTGDGSGDNWEIERQKLVDEAAQRRIENRELKNKMSEMEPLIAEYNKWQESQKSESEKQAEQLAEMQKQIADAERSVRVAKFHTLAARAGVPDDVVGDLNIDNFDIDDEPATVEMLKTKYGKTAVPAGGRMSNPPTDGSLTLEQWAQMDVHDRLEQMDKLPKSDKRHTL